MDPKYIRHHLCRQLTEKELAALVRIAEEASELAQAATKLLRWGPWSFDPTDPSRVKNYTQVLNEYGDVTRAVDLFQEALREGELIRIAKEDSDGR